MVGHLSQGSFIDMEKRILERTAQKGEEKKNRRQQM